MKKIITLLLLVLPLLTFAQKRGHRQKSDNVFHNREFWQTQPDVATVKEKIKEGNSAEKSNKAAFDAVCYAIMAKAPIQTIEFLLSLKGNPIDKKTHDGRSYLMWAGYAGDIKIMKLLLDRGADTKIVGSHGYNWFTFTVNAGHENTEIYDLMLTHGVDLKETNREGANAILLLAPHTQNGKIIAYFKSKGLNVNATDKKGNNIVFYAAKRGNIAMMKEYIAKGFDYKKTNADGENLVLFASKGSRRDSNSIEVYRYFDSLGLAMNLTNNNSETVLHHIAKNSKDIAIVDFFIDKGVDISKKDKDGNTAFLNAVKGNNSVIIEELISGVKNINQQNKEGFSALTYATQRVNLEVLNRLQKKGADVKVVDAKGNNLFYHLFTAYNRRNSKGFEPFVSALQSAGVSFKSTSKEQSPLHIAIAKGEPKLINKALELGADINQKNNNGLTPLHLAAMKTNNPRLLKMLLKNGADKTVLTDFDESAFDLAKENELLKGVELGFLNVN